MHEFFIEKLKKTPIFSTDAPIIVAVSGGVDSMVLLHVVYSLKKTIILAHVHHGVRQASDEELAYLKSWAEARSIPFESKRLSFESFSDFQDQARKKRLTFFNELSQKYNTPFIAMGHHRDDQAETFLMRLINNHDPLSVKSMRAQSQFQNLTILRPFLDIEKQTLIAYAKQNNIHYFKDVTNRSNAYERNRIRNQIIPLVHKENPRYLEAFERHMEFVNEAEQLIKEKIDTLPDLTKDRMPLKTYFSLPRIVRHQYLQTHLDKLNAESSLGYHHFLSIDQQLNTQSNFVYPLKDSLTIHKEYDTFYMKDSPPNTPCLLNINSQGIYTINENLRLIISKKKKNHKTFKSFELWYNNKVYPLQFRTRAQGDYIQFSYGRKKLKDYLIENKISPAKRDQLLLLTRGSKILWIPELRVSSIQNETKQVIYVSLECI